MNPLIHEIPSLEKSPEDVYVIHACLIKADNIRHFSPRVICIYVQNLNGSFSERFSIEKYASKNNISLDIIADWYDDLEIYILDDFNSFLKGNSNSTFIYWLDEQELILDIIKSRFEELNKGNTSKVFHQVSASSRKSLQFLMKKVTNDEIPNDLKLFIKKFNKEQLIVGYLNTGHESNCFDKKEFHKISTSVTSKVSFFAKLLSEHASKQITSSSTTVYPPIDLQTMKLFDLLKNLNLKSWLFLLAILSFGFSVGLGVSKLLSSNDIKSLKEQNINLEKSLLEKRKELDDIKSSVIDSTAAHKKQIFLLNKNFQERTDSMNRLQDNSQIKGKKK